METRMTCPNCGNGTFGYPLRMLMCIWGPVHCRRCKGSVSFAVKTNRITSFIMTAILIAAFVFTDLFTFLFVVLGITLLFATIYPLFAPLAPSKRQNRFRSTMLQIFRFVLLPICLLFLLILVPTLAICQFFAPPVIKRNIDISILRPMALKQDTTKDAMQVIRRLPAFSSSDSILIYSSCANKYATNPELELLTSDGYQKLLPLGNSTFIDTTHLSRDTSEYFKGNLLYTDLTPLSPYFKLLMIKLNNDLLNNRFHSAQADLVLALHISDLIGESEIGIISTMSSIVYAKRAMKIVQQNVPNIQNAVDLGALDSILSAYSPDYTIILNSLRKEYLSTQKMIQAALEQTPKKYRARYPWQHVWQKKILDVQETLDINSYAWARILAEASLPPYSRDTIEHYETALLQSYSNDPLSFRLLIYPNTIGRTLMGVAIPKFRGVHHKAIGLLRQKCFLQTLIALQQFRTKQKHFPSLNDFSELNTPDDPRTQHKFAYDSLTHSLSGEIDTVICDTLLAQL